MRQLDTHTYAVASSHACSTERPEAPTAVERAEAWAMLVRGAEVVVERADAASVAALADGVAALERALGIPLDGSDPAPVVTARRLARVWRAADRTPWRLDTADLVRIARQVAHPEPVTPASLLPPSTPTPVA